MLKAKKSVRQMWKTKKKTSAKELLTWELQIL